MAFRSSPADLWVGLAKDITLRSAPTTMPNRWLRTTWLRRPKAKQIDAAFTQQLGVTLQRALQALVDVNPVALQARQIDPPSHTGHEPFEIHQIEEGVVQVVGVYRIHDAVPFELNLAELPLVRCARAPAATRTDALASRRTSSSTLSAPPSGGPGPLRGLGVA